jgi:hypothetical protein
LYCHGPLSATEFLRRFLLHVLPSGFMRVRQYGLLANRQKNEKLARCRELLGCRPSPALPPCPAESVQQRIKRLTGVDIARCPVCGTGLMRIIEKLAFCGRPLCSPPILPGTLPRPPSYVQPGEHWQAEPQRVWRARALRTCPPLAQRRQWKPGSGASTLRGRCPLIQSP